MLGELTAAGRPWLAIDMAGCAGRARSSLDGCDATVIGLAEPRAAAGDGEPARTGARSRRPGPCQAPGRADRGGLRAGQPGGGGHQGRPAAGLRGLRMGRGDRRRAARCLPPPAVPAFAQLGTRSWLRPGTSAATRACAPRSAGSCKPGWNRCGRARPGDSSKAGIRPTSRRCCGERPAGRGRPGRQTRAHLSLAGHRAGPGGRAAARAAAVSPPIAIVVAPAVLPPGGGRLVRRDGAGDTGARR